MTVTREELRRSAILADQPDEALDWLIANGEEHTFETGDVVAKQGDPAEHMQIYIEGELHFQRKDQAENSMIWKLVGGDISGKLPFSRMSHYPGQGRVASHTRVLLVHESKFDELTARFPRIVERLVWEMIDRTRESSQLVAQNERMASLGKLSAGLAHELNNPSSAAMRASASLRNCVTQILELTSQLDDSDLTCRQRSAISAFERQITGRVCYVTPMDELDRSDLVERIQAHLTWHGVERAYDAAPALADAQISLEELEALTEQVSGPALNIAALRSATYVRLMTLACEAEISSRRISELVRAIKDYSYLDQTPLQDVDIHAGIMNTLTILNHKTRHGIKVVRNFDPDLPRVHAFGTELNQVWTNLFDNAIQAMKGEGTLTITTQREFENVCITVEDSGPGIPPDIQTRIFEPFFTTKGVGQGTGLGLDLVRKIIMRHHGTIHLTESRPGKTVFEVRLPIHGTPSTGPSIAKEGTLPIPVNA